MDELISVIVPVYNVKKYLLNCVDSIIKQSYTNLEILIIDDGSTDGSKELCDELLKYDNRIKVFHKKNGGLSDARNFGIDHSNGKFFAFIDSDDTLHKDFFLKLMCAQKKYNADIVGCDMSLYHNLSELQSLYEIDYKIKEKVFSREEALKEYFSPLHDRILHHGLCMKVYNRQLFEKLRFECGRLHEDLYITYRLIDSSNKVVYIDCPYYFYYQNNAGSICKNYGVKNFLDEAEAYDRIYNYFKSQNRISEELLHFLIIQYLLMFEKGYEIRKKKEIQVAFKSSKTWVRRHINECSYFNIIKRILILASLSDIRIYTLLKKVRGR